MRKLIPIAELLLRTGKYFYDSTFQDSGVRRRGSPLRPSSNKLSASDLRDALVRLAIVPSDVLVLHSDTSAVYQLGWEPSELIDFLLGYLGPQGTLVMPSHPLLKTVDGVRVYQPRRSPSTVGLITELFRRRTETLRSQYPFSAVAAQGAKAEELICEHRHSFAPHDEKSPYGKLKDLNAKVLAWGCALERMTIIHVAEDSCREELGIENFYQCEMIRVETADHAYDTETHRRAPWLWWYLSKYLWIYEMNKKGFVRKIKIGDVALRAVDASTVIEWMQAEIRDQKSIYPLARMNTFLQLEGPENPKRWR